MSTSAKITWGILLWLIGTLYLHEELGIHPLKGGLLIIFLATLAGSEVTFGGGRPRRNHHGE